MFVVFVSTDFWGGEKFVGCTVALSFLGFGAVSDAFSARSAGPKSAFVKFPSKLIFLQIIFPPPPCHAGGVHPPPYSLIISVQHGVTPTPQTRQEAHTFLRTGGVDYSADSPRTQTHHFSRNCQNKESLSKIATHEGWVLEARELMGSSFIYAA